MNNPKEKELVRAYKTWRRPKWGKKKTGTGREWPVKRGQFLPRDLGKRKFPPALRTGRGAKGVGCRTGDTVKNFHLRKRGPLSEAKNRERGQLLKNCREEWNKERRVHHRDSAPPDSRQGRNSALTEPGAPPPEVRSTGKGGKSRWNRGNVDPFSHLVPEGWRGATKDQ